MSASSSRSPERLSIAIIGRPNVGKSTLFNRLAHKKLAIVDNTPGVTRDWRATDGDLYDIPITLIDTAGLEEEKDQNRLESKMRRQTERAIQKARVALFMIDGRAGITPLDEHFARILRKQGGNYFLIVNKCENEEKTQAALAEGFSLGLGEPIPISAEHGHGIEDIYDHLLPIYKQMQEDQKNSETLTDGAEEDQDEDLSEPEKALQRDIDSLEGNEEFDFASLKDIEDEKPKPLKIAIIGRPNVGKSSLLNAVLGDERSLTGPEAGITRDTVNAAFEFEGISLRLVDTAGLRKKSRIKNKLESLSAQESLRAIRLSQVTILLLDVTLGLENQDLKIAAMAIEEGRALVIAINKWDIVKDKGLDGDKILEDVKIRLTRSLSQTPDIPLITLSALKKRNIHKLMRQVITISAQWKSRISTAPLNKWLRDIYAKTPPPLVEGRSNKLRYITQIKTRPPTFALWAARPDDIPKSYKRFLINRLREKFNIPSVPVRLLCRTSKNPFA